MSGVAKTPEGPQGNSKSSENEHHGEDTTKGMGNTTSEPPKPSEENLSHGFHALPREILLEVLTYVALEELHASVRYVSREVYSLVDAILSRDDYIRYINRKYGVMWTFGGYTLYSLSPDKHPLSLASLDELQIATVFEWQPQVLVGEASVTPLTQNVQLFFSWSVHTITSMRVYLLPYDYRKRQEKVKLQLRRLYVGYVDYRRLLNWISFVNSRAGFRDSHWLIPM